MRGALRRLWEHVFFRPASPLGLMACRVIVCAHALWILLSRPDLPGLAAWPREFWLGAGTALPLRFGIVGPFPLLEQALFVLVHVSLVACLLGVRPRLTALVSGLLLYHFAPFEEIVAGIPHTSFGGLTVPVLALLILSFAEPPRWHSPDSPEHRWPLALIQLLLSLSYLFPTLAKLRFSGPDWFTGANIGNYLLANHAITAAPYALALAGSRWACRLIALGTFLLELLSPLVVVWPAFAMAFVPAALAFHAGIVLGLGYFFPSAPLLLVYLDWDRISRWMARRRAQREPMPRRAVA